MSRPRATRLQDHMRAIEADVWVLTETHPHVALDSTHRLAASSSPASDRSGDERWVTIWVRMDLDATSCPTTDLERTACARWSSIHGATWYVYGTVLPWHSDKRRQPIAGELPFIAALKEQESDWASIRDTDPKARLLVAGDFNQDLLDEGHYYGSRSRRRALQAALDRTGLTCVTGGTTDPVARQISGHASVDHVCIPRDSSITVTGMTVWPSTEQLRRGLSDHFGVTVSLNVATMRCNEQLRVSRPVLPPPPFHPPCTGRASLRRR